MAKLYFYIPFSNIAGIIKAYTCFYLEYFRVTKNGLKRRQVVMKCLENFQFLKQIVWTGKLREGRNGKKKPRSI